MSARQKFLPPDFARLEFGDPLPELRQRIEDVGGVQAAAALLGVTRQSLHGWLTGSAPFLACLGALRVLNFATVWLHPEWPDDPAEDDRAEAEVCA
jgi:hypothetical protein